MSDSKRSATTKNLSVLMAFHEAQIRLRLLLFFSFFSSILPDLPFPILSWTHQFPLFVQKELTQPYSKWLTVTSTFFFQHPVSACRITNHDFCTFPLNFLPHKDTRGAGKIESIRQHVSEMWHEIPLFYFIFLQISRTQIRWAQDLHQHSLPAGPQWKPQMSFQVHTLTFSVHYKVFTCHINLYLPSVWKSKFKCLFLKIPPPRMPRMSWLVSSHKPEQTLLNTGCVHFSKWFHTFAVFICIENIFYFLTY